MRTGETPFLDASHTQLAAAVRECGRSRLHSKPEETQDIDGAAREALRFLAGEGLLRYAAGKNFGGVFEPIDVRSICVIRQALSYYSGLADVMFAMQGLGSYAITIAGAPSLREKLLPRVTRGDAIAAIAITEPEAGSDLAAIATTATRRGSTYLLNGMKRFISNAGIADFYTVFAKTDPAAGHKGISAFVVEKDFDGLRMGERIDVIAPHPLGEIHFENCEVPQSHMLGEEGEGFKIAMRTLDTFRSSVAAAALGMAERALDEAIAFSRRRVQFGQPLSEFQSTKFKIAEMETQLEAGELLTYRAAWLKDRGAPRVTKQASMAKFFSTEAAQQIIDAAVQIHGGAGVVRGAAVERLYREIRALRIYEGTTEIQKLIIASEVLK